jgi:hypothetical protein
VIRNIVAEQMADLVRQEIMALIFPLVNDEEAVTLSPVIAQVVKAGIEAYEMQIMKNMHRVMQPT